ncbi:MAG: glycoside hydrolase family 3 N-terminal domain-containing protein [Candidatus Sulfotelmatobacter sp.]
MTIRTARRSNRYLCTLILLGTSLCQPWRLSAQASASPLTDQQVRDKASALLRQMTLDEKIAQLSQLPGFPAPEFRENSSQTMEEILKKVGAGSVLWVSDPKEINRLQHVAVEQSRLHIPVLFGLDVIHGYHTIFPAPIAMASSWDTKMVEGAQAVAAQEARAAGIQWTFAPMVDIARDARWGRMVEGAGEDPFLGAAMARAQVLGFQGKEMGNPDHVLACVKHFAGYGAADGGRDYDSSYIPEEEMWNVYLPPFKAALDAGVGSVMSAYMDLNDVPASGNPWLLDEVLRKSWGFQGFVVSDAFAVRSLVTHGYARDNQDAARKAFSAGLNMDMASGVYLKYLPIELQEGHISMQQIDNAVLPILETKFRMGLFEHPYTDVSRLEQVLNDPAHGQMARAAVQRSTVLLRNDGGLLPLDKNGLGKTGKTIHSIAVIGPLGDTDADLLSMWGAMTKPGPTVSVVQGIREKVGSAVSVAYAHGPNLTRQFPSPFENIPIVPMKEQPAQTPQEAQQAIQDAVALARRSDVAILVLGEIDLMSAEYASRSSLRLSNGQEELLEAVAGTGKPVVLVLVNGRPLDITWAAEHVAAILEAWYPGSEGGRGIADVLFGDANPSGHLPVSWPRSAGQLPLYYNHNLTQNPETAPNFKSRYWDLPSTPLYPFGYGLSYTTFSFDNLKVTPTARVGGMILGGTIVGGTIIGGTSVRGTSKDTIEVSADVTNTGGRTGDTVVQFYIHQRAGSASRPVRQLKGFERVTLEPGAKRTVHFTLAKDELQFWSPIEKKWVVEPEQFDVWVGEDSTAKLHGEFRLTE